MFACMYVCDPWGSEIDKARRNGMKSRVKSTRAPVLFFFLVVQHLQYPNGKYYSV